MHIALQPESRGTELMGVVFGAPEHLISSLKNHQPMYYDCVRSSESVTAPFDPNAS